MSICSLFLLLLSIHSLLAGYIESYGKEREIEKEREIIDLGLCNKSRN